MTKPTLNKIHIQEIQAEDSIHKDSMVNKQPLVIEQTPSTSKDEESKDGPITAPINQRLKISFSELLSIADRETSQQLESMMEIQREQNQLARHDLS